MARGYRFWFRYLWQTVAVGAAAAAVMFLLTGVGINIRWVQISGVLAGLPYYLVLGSAIALTMICFTTHLVYFPLVLSLGSTRREAFLCFLLYRLGTVVVTTALCLALLLPTATGETWQLLPVWVLILLFSCSLGSLMGLSYQKLKFLGILMMVVLFALVGGCVGFFLAGGEAQIFVDLFAALGRYVVIGGILWLLSAALDLALTHLALKHREVKL